MATGDADTKLARKVRTFAEDLRRAKEGGPQKPVAPLQRAPLIKQVTAQPTQGATKITKALPPKQESHLTDEGRLLDIQKEAKGYAEATLVRDTKRKQWSLGRALGDSLHSWVKEQKETLEEQARERNPVPKVSPSFNRKEIIERARKESVLAPKDDRTVVIEKLRTFASDAARATGRTYVVAHDPKPEDIAPHWSSEEEPKPKVTRQDAPDLRAAVGAILPQAEKAVSTTPERRATQRPLQQTRLAAESPAPKQLASDVAPQIKQTRVESAYVKLQRAQAAQATPHIVLPKKPAPPPAYPAFAKAPTPVPTPTVPSVTPPVPPAVPAVREIAFEQPSFEKKETTNFRTYRGDALADIQGRNLSAQNIAAAEATRRARAPIAAAETPAAHPARPFVIAGIFMIIVIALGGIGFFWFAREAGTLPNTPDITRIPAHIPTDTQRSVQFSSNRDTLLESLTAAIPGSSDAIVQIYPVEAGDTVAVPTSRFMFVLDPRAPGSFLRNLEEDMMFGSYRGLAPFFILKTRQFDTAFAGMLDWEQYMSADLTPLFGEPVERTLDTSLRTVTQTSAAFFVDETVGNIDVRVLRDERGEERIVYAFVDQTTIIVTATTAALSELVGLAR